MYVLGFISTGIASAIIFLLFLHYLEDGDE